MRHRVYGKHLSRSKNQRTSLFRGLVRNLILDGFFVTTEPKAKAVKGLIDKIVTAGRKNTPASLRVIQSNIPQVEVIRKLLEEITPNYLDRASGFTTSVKLGQRVGDKAMMVKVEWSGSEKSQQVSKSASPKESVSDSTEKTEKPVEKKTKVKKEEAK